MPCPPLGSCSKCHWQSHALPPPAREPVPDVEPAGGDGAEGGVAGPSVKPPRAHKRVAGASVAGKAPKRAKKQIAATAVAADEEGAFGGGDRAMLEQGDDGKGGEEEQGWQGDGGEAGLAVNTPGSASNAGAAAGLLKMQHPGASQASRGHQELPVTTAMMNLFETCNIVLGNRKEASADDKADAMDELRDLAKKEKELLESRGPGASCEDLLLFNSLDAVKGLLGKDWLRDLAGAEPDTLEKMARKCARAVVSLSKGTLGKPPLDYISFAARSMSCA
jgi:hypothetical protein